MDIRTIITAADDLTPILQHDLTAMWENIFNDTEDGLVWTAAADWHIMVLVDAKLASNVDIFVRMGTVAGQTFRMGGIGNVMTLPDYRGRGYASQAMDKARTFMSQVLKLEFAVLICEEHLIPFYESLGWQCVNAPVYFDQPGGKTLNPQATMFLTCSERSWVDGEVYLGGLPY